MCVCVCVCVCVCAPVGGVGGCHSTLCPCLQTTGKRLPEWGFKQLEAVTSKSADVLSSLWHIEELEVAGADLSQPNSQSSGITGDSDSSEGEGEESSSEGEAEESSSEGEGEESSAGGSDGVGVANKSDEAKTEGEPSTDIGEDATNEAMELKGKGSTLVVKLCSGRVASTLDVQMRKH